MASSGDYESKDMMFPADEPNVISVGSLSANMQISDFTNAPSECLIIAPGDDIKTVNNKLLIEETSGTSQATVLTSGYIALLRDYALKNNIPLNNEMIRNIMKGINDKKDTYVDALLKMKNN